MASKLDITNMKFGKLTAIKPNGFYQSPSRKHILWLCKCDCGIEKTVRLNSLRSGKLQSCVILLIEHKPYSASPYFYVTLVICHLRNA